MNHATFSKKRLVDFSKGGEFTQENIHTTPQGITLDQLTEQGALTSDPMEVPAAQAVAARWTAKMPEEACISLDIRTSVDREHWSSWKRLDEDSHSTEDDSRASRSHLVFVEQPCRFLQYRMTLTPVSQQTSPVVEKLELHLFETGETSSATVHQIAEINSTGAEESTKSTTEGLALSKPPVVDRSIWCPQGCEAGAPEYTTVTHIIVHHTADSGTADYAAWVRAIYAYHVEVNGWPDIGYNYLIDPNGTIYEGRAGGDNVIGYHFSCVNANTLGVALLGTFNTAPPTTAAFNSLRRLVAWKCSQRGLDPLGITQHPPTGSQLDVISGHRDANDKPNTCGTTSCPGQVLYDLLPSIRRDVALTVQGHTAGDWVNTYGSDGFCLAAWARDSDYSYFPRTVLDKLELVRGSRYQWGRATDLRALESPDEQDRVAAVFVDEVQLVIRLHFAQAYSDVLHLYMVDYDRWDRRQAVIVDDDTSSQIERVTLPFDQGLWLHFPITVDAGQSVTITVNELAGKNAVLSGLFLGGAGAPPLPDRAPQGDWVGGFNRSWRHNASRSALRRPRLAFAS